MIHIITSNHWTMPTMLLNTSLWHTLCYFGVFWAVFASILLLQKESPQLEIASLYLTVFASPPVYEFLMHLTVGFFTKTIACAGRTKQTTKAWMKEQQVLSPRTCILHLIHSEGHLLFLNEGVFWCRWGFLIAVVNNKWNK